MKKKPNKVGESIIHKRKQKENDEIKRKKQETNKWKIKEILLREELTVPRRKHKQSIYFPELPNLSEGKKKEEEKSTRNLNRKQTTKVEDLNPRLDGV